MGEPALALQPAVPIKKSVTPNYLIPDAAIWAQRPRASRVAPSFRGKLEHLVDEVECSTCGGGRLRDDAAAMRLQNRTIDD